MKNGFTTIVLTVRRDVSRSITRFSTDEAPDGPAVIGALGELPYFIGTQIRNEELFLSRRVEWVEHGLVWM